MAPNKYIKKVISIIVPICILLAFGYVIYGFGNYVSTLEKQVRDRNVLIKKLANSEKIITFQDTLLDINDKRFNECNKLIQNYEKQLTELENKMILYKDSTNNLRITLDLIKKNYGIGYKIRKDSIYYNIQLEGTSKVDSALMILPYYGEKLHYDEESNKWLITVK